MTVHVLPTAPAPTPPELVSDIVAAQILGRSPVTLRKWRVRSFKTGTLHGPPFRKYGRGVLYDLTELHAWAEAHTFRAPAVVAA